MYKYSQNFLFFQNNNNFTERNSEWTNSVTFAIAKLPQYSCYHNPLLVIWGLSGLEINTTCILFIYNKAHKCFLYCNQQNALIKIQQNISHKTYFILGTNSHMFHNQGAIIREFINS